MERELELAATQPDRRKSGGEDKEMENRVMSDKQAQEDMRKEEQRKEFKKKQDRQRRVEDERMDQVEKNTHPASRLDSKNKYFSSKAFGMETNISLESETGSNDDDFEKHH